MIHNFDVKIAKIYGVDGAIIIHNLYFWIEKNRANNKHCYEGKYWTYNSLKAFTELFPYWTHRQIEYLLKKLETMGAILSDNHNKCKYDRTKWYCLTDEIYCLYGHDFSNTQNCEMKKLEMCNKTPENVRPIPDINTYIKTDIKNNNKIVDDNKIVNSKSKKNSKKIKTKIESMLDTTVTDKVVDKLLTDYEINRINYYLDNWDRFSNIVKKNKVGFFIDALKNNYDLPIVERRKTAMQYEFEQRKYNEDDWKCLFKNC